MKHVLNVVAFVATFLVEFFSAARSKARTAFNVVALPAMLLATLFVAFKWITVDRHTPPAEMLMWAGLFFVAVLLSGTVLMQYRHGEGQFARIVQRIYEDL